MGVFKRGRGEKDSQIVGAREGRWGEMRMENGDGVKGGEFGVCDGWKILW